MGCLAVICASAGCGGKGGADAQPAPRSSAGEDASAPAGDEETPGPSDASSEEGESLPSGAMPAAEYFSMERPWDDGSAASFRELGREDERVEVDGRPIFLADGKRVVWADENGENEKILYEGDAPIKGLSANRSLLFFIRNEHEICRVYRPTGQVDVVAASEQPIDFCIPLSNTAVLWREFTPEGAAFMERISQEEGLLWIDFPQGQKAAQFYFRNALTGEQRQVQETEFDPDTAQFVYEIDESEEESK